ncbi:MAG: hypothetical protein AB7P17_02695, partial [Nitrospirales bacterium]
WLLPTVRHRYEYEDVSWFGLLLDLDGLATFREFDDAAILFFVVTNTGHVLSAAVLDHVPDKIAEEFKVGTVDN